MKQEVRHYNTTQEIKQIVMGIQHLRCRRSVEREYYLAQRSATTVDRYRQAKDSAKHELLNMIGDFILVKEAQDGFYIEAELFLPYVRDYEITQVEKDRDYWEKALDVCSRDKIELHNKIRLLERPWWKKLLKIDK